MGGDLMVFLFGLSLGKSRVPDSKQKAVWECRQAVLRMIRSDTIEELTNASHSATKAACCLHGELIHELTRKVYDLRMELTRYVKKNGWLWYYGKP